MKEKTSIGSKILFVVLLIRHMHENSPFGLVCAIGGIFTRGYEKPSLTCIKEGFWKLRRAR